jgi:hypothetical protein
MKFCPYCGATLLGGAASFCPECGKETPFGPKAPAKDAAQRHNADRRPPNTGKKPPSGGRKPDRAAPPQKKPSANKARKPPSNQAVKRPEPPRAPKPDPRDEGYDGYYDDVQPIDDGQTRDRTDPELLKRAVLIAAGALGIVILAAIVMYVL